MERYVYAGNLRLRCGYTTGSCAAMAAKAAAQLLLGGVSPPRVGIAAPDGAPLEADVVNAGMQGAVARAAVQKDAGDDIDVTDGILIVAEVQKTREPGIAIVGGQGVGRVTKPGLEQPVGAPAINSTPRRMIRGAVAEVCRLHGYKGGLRVCIVVPGGQEAARKTFNPGMGIEGGISILGTTGIVHPRSLPALRDSIELEIRQLSALGHRFLVVTPGNYGQAFLKTLRLPRAAQPVSCANFIGDSMDFAARYGFERVLVAGHIGKMVKVAGGIMDTHSRVADCRCELFCAHAAAAGATRETAKKLLAAPTSDACVEILQQRRLLAPVMHSLGKAVVSRLERRAAGAFPVEAILFSNRHGTLYESPGIQSLCTHKEEP